MSVCSNCSTSLNIFTKKKCNSCHYYHCSKCLMSLPVYGISPRNKRCCLKCQKIHSGKFSRKDLEVYKLKELMSFLNSKGIPIKDCKEKNDLIDLLLKQSRLNQHENEDHERHVQKLKARLENDMSNSERIIPQNNQVTLNNLTSSFNSFTLTTSATSNISLESNSGIVSSSHIAPNFNLASNGLMNPISMFQSSSMNIDDVDNIISEDDKDSPYILSDLTNISKEMKKNNVNTLNDINKVNPTIKINTSFSNTPNIMNPNTSNRFDHNNILIESSNNDIPITVNNNLTSSAQLVINQNEDFKIERTEFTPNNDFILENVSEITQNSQIQDSQNHAVSNDTSNFFSEVLKENISNYDPNKRLILEDIKSAADISQLTVKQLKQLLTCNFVNYKGCCEKPELMFKLQDLWKEHNKNKSYNDLSQMHNDNLCKICMSEIIDCILLECGHMVACKQCGRKLAECPICRKYVSRIVHIFRA